MSVRNSAPLASRMPSEAEIENANDLRQILATQIKDDEPLHVQVPTEKGKLGDIVLMPDLAKTLLEVLRYIGAGQAVTIMPLGQYLTTQEAADLLNVSRPHFVQMLERKELPFMLVGRHRRVKAADLFDFKNRRDGVRADALSELAKGDADFI